jgi:hypothetical protein
MNYLIGGTFATFIGTNLLSHVIEGTLGILYTSATFIKNGNNSNYVIKKIQNKIEEMDITIKLELVKTLKQTLPDNEINKILENGLIDLITKIKSTIEWIDYEIERHNRKWFSSYRILNIDNQIEDLEHLIIILDNRIKLLLSVKNNYSCNKFIS